MWTAPAAPGAPAVRNMSARLWWNGKDALNKPRSHLIELALVQEHLEDQDEAPHGRQLLHEVPHILGRLGAVGCVEADVKVEAADNLLELDDGHLCLANDLHEPDVLTTWYTLHDDDMAEPMPPALRHLVIPRSWVMCNCASAGMCMAVCTFLVTGINA